MFLLPIVFAFGRVVYLRSHSPRIGFTSCRPEVQIFNVSIRLVPYEIFDLGQKNVDLQNFNHQT
jgi:hypothetical protein